MPYSFNPHCHVKIWLSKDPDVFLNIENQLRLIKMRHINPQDTIYLLYDHTLLSASSLERLARFCRKYAIIPLDVQKDIIPKCQNKLELNLIEIYRDEVEHLAEGGNLAVASDVLRWLKIVYTLGIYSDFDTYINTERLSFNEDVSTFALFNVGSLTIRTGAEIPIASNDIIAIIDPEAAFPLIEQIQQAIVNAFSQNLFAFYSSRCHAPVQKSILVALSRLADMGFTPREARAKIISMGSDNLSFCRITEESINARASRERIAISRLRHLSKERRDWIHLDDEQLIEKIRETYQNVHIKSSVIYTSGPYAITEILKANALREDPEDPLHYLYLIKRFAFETFGLRNSFYSSQVPPFHYSEEQFDQESLDTYKSNDCSWVPGGMLAVQKREQKMDHAAHIIQRFFRMHKPREQVSEKILPEEPKLIC